METQKDQDTNPAEQAQQQGNDAKEASFADAFDQMGESAGDPPDAAGDPEEESVPQQVDQGRLDEAAVRPVEAHDAAAPAAGAQAEDIWANATPEQRAALETLNSQLAETEQRARSDAGRQAALQRQLQELKSAGVSRQQISEAMKSPESWKKLTEDYPDIARPIREMLDTQAKSIRDEVAAQVQPLLEAREQEEIDRHQRFISAQVDALNKAHPDWQATKESSQFKTWLALQPPLIRAGVKSQNAEDAILVLNQFKSAKTEQEIADTQQRRQQRLNQAVTQPGKNRAAQPGRQEIPADADFNTAWDAMDRRQAAQQ